MNAAKKKKILVALIDALAVPLEGVGDELNCTFVCMCVQASFRRAWECTTDYGCFCCISITFNLLECPTSPQKQ